MSHFIKPERDDLYLIGIKKVSNGFVVQQSDGCIDDSNIPQITEVVFEEKEDVTNSDDNDLDKIVELLYHIKEYLDCRYSKHKKRNIVIKVEETNGD